MSYRQTMPCWSIRSTATCSNRSRSGHATSSGSSRSSGPRLNAPASRSRCVSRFSNFRSCERCRPNYGCEAERLILEGPRQDVYGPTANDPEIEALVVSEETRAGGDASTLFFLSFSLSLVSSPSPNPRGIDLALEYRPPFFPTPFRSAPPLLASRLASRFAVNKLRAEKSLGVLHVFCISLVADSAPPSSSPSSNPNSEDKAYSGTESAATTGQVLVSPATKMGSTGIREWLARRKGRGEDRE